jgi:hypothetical protein
LCLTNVSLCTNAIKDDAVYKPDITVPVSIMINNNEAIGMFVASAHPSELGRCDVR